MVDKMIKNYGYCPCCKQETLFKSDQSWLRDHYLCTKCGCKPRERALMTVIEKFCPEWEKLSIHESSPINRGASIRLKKECENYFPSQYWPDKKLNEVYEGFYNIDLKKNILKKVALIW